MGVVLLISRVWDAFSDPVVGYLSDRTHTRWGRRRPWMVAGALPAALVFVLMWNPPGALAGRALELWMGVCVVLFYSAMTVIVMPYDSLAAELSLDYQERNRVFGVRRAAFGGGAVAVFLSLAVLSDPARAREGAAAITSVGGVLTVLLILGSAALLRERPEFLERRPQHPLRALGDVLRNRHARLLLSVFFIQQLGVTGITILVPYYAEYVLGNGAVVMPILASFFLFGLVSIPVWLRLGRRFEKRSLSLFAMCGVALTLASLGLLGKGDLGLVLLVTGVAGVLAGALDVLVPSIQADVIDFDELRSGERKEGLYFAVWNLAGKAAVGVSAAAVGFALQASGFVHGRQPGTVQPESALQAIRLMMSAIPLVTYTAGIGLFMRFRLSRADHEEVRAALAARV